MICWRTSCVMRLSPVRYIWDDNGRCGRLFQSVIENGSRFLAIYVAAYSSSDRIVGAPSTVTNFSQPRGPHVATKLYALAWGITFRS